MLTKVLALAFLAASPALAGIDPADAAASAIEPASLRDFHTMLAREPHMAGTPGDARVVNDIAAVFEADKRNAVVLDVVELRVPGVTEGGRDFGAASEALVHDRGHTQRPWIAHQPHRLIEDVDANVQHGPAE